jgi:hypothetical protein
VSPGATGYAAGYFGFDNPLADMYARRALDCIVELVTAFSHDVPANPVAYQSLSEPVRDSLHRFRTLVGNDPEWPNIIDRSTLSGRFMNARYCAANAAARKAAVVYFERGSERVEPSLRRAFVETARGFRPQRAGGDQAHTVDTARRSRTIVREAVEVLLSDDLARVLGVPPVPPGDWPDGGVYSAEAAATCEAITARIERLHPGVAVTAEKFSQLQRVAHHGGATITALSGDGLDDEASLDAALEAAYNWTLALQELVADLDVLRAWTDLTYRRGLQVIERDMLSTHPSGDLQLTDTPLDPARLGKAFQLSVGTQTVYGEVCCCSGDLCHGSDYCHTTDIGFTCQTTCSTNCG